MTTKNYLGQIERFEKMVQNKLSEINQLKTMACSVTVPAGNERVQTSSDKDKVGTIVSRIADLEKEVDSMIEKRCMIVKQIESIEDTDIYDVLAKRYILKKDLKVIAVEKGVSFRHMGRVHFDALKMFEKKYGSEYFRQSSPEMS